MSEQLGKRNLWIFHFQANDVAAAARLKEEYHLRRVEFWKSEQQKTASELEKSSVKIHRQAVTGGERIEAVVDQTAAWRLRDCEAKIVQHQKSADEYHRWAAALDANTTAIMTLDVDDVHFFGLGDNTLPDDSD